jgi:HEAT repeat protein
MRHIILKAALILMATLWGTYFVPQARAQDKVISDLAVQLEEAERTVALGKKSVPALIEALSHETSRVNAINLLGRIGDASAIPALIKMTTRKDCASTASLRALANIGGTEVVPVLLQGLEADLARPAEKQDSSLQRDLVEGLAAIGDSRVIDPFLRILQGKDGPTRAVAKGLGSFRDPRVRRDAGLGGLSGSQLVIG